MPANLQIDAQALDIQKVFQDFYTVPSFQREYVWERQHVETMLNDIKSEFDRQRDQGKDNAEYFLGSIVTCLSQDGNSYELIDGQQRITTLYLLLCAIRDYMFEKGISVRSSLELQIRSSQPLRGGGEKHRYRVDLQYPDGSEILEYLGNPERIEDPEVLLEANKLSKSSNKILAAYITIRDFIRTYFGTNDEVSNFWTQLIYDVKLIRIVTPDLSQALQIFETINERGVGLTATDLLKNLLFMKAQNRDSKQIGDKWRAMINQISDKEKPLRFLRYFVLSQYYESEPGLTENDIYPWFRDNPETHRIADDPVTFMDKLAEYCDVYLKFIDNKGPDGEDNPYLQNISLEVSSLARQHFILLMAVKDLPIDLFNRFCSQLENLLYCYLITRQRTNVLESNIIRWAQKARKIRTENDLVNFLRETIWKDLRNRQREFETAFIALSLNNFSKYRMRYTLGKIAQYIEREAGRTPAELRDIVLGRSSKTTPQIEHILSQTPSEELLYSFDVPEEYYRYSQMLGNLTLLEPTLNSSSSNGSYREKQTAYENSMFLLTSSLVKQHRVGNNTQFNRGIELLKQFDEWTSTSIVRRQEMLLEIARRVWFSEVNS